MASYQPSPAFADELRRYHADYLASRPWAQEIDPLLVRQACAETLLADLQRRRNEIPPAFRDGLA